MCVGNVHRTTPKGNPFEPAAQLLAVMPPQSAPCLPDACAPLMRAADSPLCAIYPTTVRLDPNDQRHRWQWVALLPFIDEGLLLTSLATVKPEFTEEENHFTAASVTSVFFKGDRKLPAQFEFIEQPDDVDKGSSTSMLHFVVPSLQRPHQCRPVQRALEGKKRARNIYKWYLRFAFC